MIFCPRPYMGGSKPLEDNPYPSSSLLFDLSFYTRTKPNTAASIVSRGTRTRWNQSGLFGMCHVRFAACWSVGSPWGLRCLSQRRMISALIYQQHIRISLIAETRLTMGVRATNQCLRQWDISPVGVLERMRRPIPRLNFPAPTVYPDGSAFQCHGCSTRIPS